MVPLVVSLETAGTVVVRYYAKQAMVSAFAATRRDTQMSSRSCFSSGSNSALKH